MAAPASGALIVGGFTGDDAFTGVLAGTTAGAGDLAAVGFGVGALRAGVAVFTGDLLNRMQILIPNLPIKIRKSDLGAAVSFFATVDFALAAVVYKPHYKINLKHCTTYCSFCQLGL